MSHPTLAAEALSKWDAIASYWDAGIGRDGNKYWRALQEPCLRRMLGAHLAKPGCRALDLATGNGLCARWLKAQGAAEVVATDGSEDMLVIAGGHEGGEGVEWGGGVGCYCGGGLGEVAGEGEGGGESLLFFSAVMSWERWKAGERSAMLLILNWETRSAAASMSSS